MEQTAQWKRRHAQFGPSRHNFERDQTNALGTGEHILLGECATALNVLTLLCTLKKKMVQSTKDHYTYRL